MSENPNKLAVIDPQTIKQMFAARTPQQIYTDEQSSAVLIVAGSLGKFGAAILSGNAALRSGASRLFLHVPLSGKEVVQTGVPEALLDLDENSEVSTSLHDIEQYKAIGIGASLGTSALTRDLISKLFELKPQQLILDADALNILATDQELWRQLPQGSILTPGLKEFARLCVREINGSKERLQQLSEMAVQKKCVLFLRSAESIIALPDGSLYKTALELPEINKSGMGDIISGLVSGIAAQGFKPEEAALIGCQLFYQACKIAREKQDPRTILPRDVLKALPKAILELSS